MRFEDAYFEETVKVSKRDKGTRPYSNNKVRVPNSKVISKLLHRMHNCMPFFLRK